MRSSKLVCSLVLALGTVLSLSALVVLHTAQAAPAATIQSMIDLAPDGGTVSIAAGTYTESLTVNKTLTLTGVSSATTIIQAVSGQRVITMTSGHNLRLENLTLTGGHPTGDAGGGVYAEGGNLQIVNCRITNNSAEWGGGVFQEGASGRLDVTGSRIELNTSVSQGGGMFVRGSAALTNTLVLSNTAGLYGGGLHVQEGRTDLNGGVFSNNRALGDNGGGVNVNNSISITGTQFISNTSNNSGGALLQWNAGYTVTVTNAHFERNSAKSQGGGASVNSTLMISNSTFVTNTVNSGNTNDTYGGGVSAGGVSQIFASTFVSNSTRCTGCISRYGGGLYTVQPTTIQGSTFDRNDAWLGGGTFANSAVITVTASTFKNNIAGYGGAVGGTEVHATGSDFLSNRVINDGGGLRAIVVTLSGGQFISNTANNNGGGVWVLDRLDAVNTLFTGNRARWGGAVNVNNSVSVTGTQFISNTANDSGGALLQSNAGYTVTVTNARFERNTAQSMGGGAFVSGTLTISNSMFVSNTVDSGSANNTFGGGLYAGGPNQISASTFAGNSAFCINGGSCSNADGGGLYSSGSNSTLTNVAFNRNQAGRLGGGMSSRSSNLTLANATFTGNLAGWGGGMSHSTGNLALTNVLFGGNLAGWGGGMINDHNSVTLTHVTFGGNQASNIGGGIDNYVSNPTLVNCILWGNNAPTGPQIANEYGSTPAITYSDIQGTSVYTGTGNINADPRFIAPITATVAPTTTGNYHLGAGSPAINAGTNVGVATDVDGELRDAAPDMGADEYRTCWARLNNSSTDYGYIQAAVDASTRPTDTVKVAGYCPGVQMRAGVTQTVYLSRTLTVRGGYTTTNWTTSNPTVNTTTLDALGRGRVVYLTGGSGVLAALENLTLRGGLINGGGGGVFNNGAQVRLANTIVRDNSVASNYGGGGLCVSSLGTLTVTNSLLTGNTASYGGGIFNSSAKLALINSTLSGNQSSTSNPALDGGGAIDQWGTSPSATIVNSTIVSNTAATINVARSGIWLENGTLTIQNSIVAGNSVTNNVKVESSAIFTSLGYNLTNSGVGTPFTATTDLANTNPLLGPLQDNGGSTWTHALLPGSPAIDRIPFGVNGCGTSLTTDQRGQPRPGTFTYLCDIGAYEAQGVHYQIYLPLVLRQ